MAGRRRRPDSVEITCSACGSSDAIQIKLNLPDGTQVDFSSCHRCEHRWWESDGEVLDLTAVLEKSRKA